MASPGAQQVLRRTRFGGQDGGEVLPESDILRQGTIEANLEGSPEGSTHH